MGAGFWAGFGEQFSETVEDNRRYIRKQKDERRTYLKNYGAKALAAQKKEVENMKNYVSYFNVRGLPTRSVQGILEKGGYSAIKNVYSMLQTRPDLDPEDLKSLIEVTSGYASDMDLNPVTLFERTLKGVRGGEENEPVRRANFFQVMVGNNPYWQEEVDAQYPELVSAIANEGMYPEGLGGDLSGLRLPKEGPSDTRLSSVYKNFVENVDNVILKDAAKAQKAFASEDDAAAGDYLQTLKKIQLLPADARIAEYTRQQPETMLIEIWKKENAEPNVILENADLTATAALYKDMLRRGQTFKDETSFKQWYKNQPKDGTKQGLYIVGNKPVYWSGF